MHLELSRGCRGVDAFGERDEINPNGLEVIQEQDEMAQIPPQPIQPPADQHIKPSALGIRHESVQRWASILHA